jgi:hypothetical protein
MHADRLLKLAGLLEADAANPKGLKFDLGTWGETPSPKDEIGISCGTIACAMGLAVLSGEFEKYGLFNGAVSSKHWILPKMDETGDTGFWAAAELFDIGYADAEHLFKHGAYPDNCPTTGAEGERAVATRIREFVADRQPDQVSA